MEKSFVNVKVWLIENPKFDLKNKTVTVFKIAKDIRNSMALY